MMYSNRQRRNFSGFHAFVACSTAVRLGSSPNPFLHSGSVLDSLEQRVSRESFLDLRDEDLREVASLLGDHVTLRNYIEGVWGVFS